MLELGDSSGNLRWSPPCFLVLVQPYWSVSFKPVLRVSAMEVEEWELCSEGS